MSQSFSSRLMGVAMALATTVAVANPVEEMPLNRKTRTTALGARAIGNGGRRGRPRKFQSPSRSLTLTLPHDVIDTLRTVDADLSRAVASVVQPMIGVAANRPRAELVSIGSGRSVIVVVPSRALVEQTGVELVPLPDGRALIALDERVSPWQLELQLGDALADAAFTGEDREIFQALAVILRASRVGSELSLAQRHIIVLQRPGAAGASTLTRA